MDIRDYLAFLNDDARIGRGAAIALAEAGIADRETVFREHPEWHRSGTLRALLTRAHYALDADARFALELTTFVLAKLPHVHIPDTPKFLRPQLEGTAWKEHGNALYMAGNRHDEALEAAARAAEILSSETVLAVDRGTALVLVALVESGQGRFREAEAALEQSIAIFAEHGETRRYLDAIQTHAIIALAQEDVPRARDWYIRAYEEADRLDDDRERARIIHNLGHCALLMNDLDTANEYLSRALSEMTRLRMTGEIERAISNIAGLERQRGHLDKAVIALCGAYPKLLDRGLVQDAVSVLLDIHDIVFEMT
ncbi:MAG TPA: tetratricopeptide repeat protein, partial [Thermoanaerobaculia bacterium]|nr:tetratricopeptide repeat protein [Thermoanaerobaculia bacterium]